jgi:hypothetical protein
MSNEILDPKGYNTDSSQFTGLIRRLMQTYKRPGQTAADFRNELNALTPGDKEWFAKQYSEEGYPTAVGVDWRFILDGPLAQY